MRIGMPSGGTRASLPTTVRTLNEPWTLGGIQLPNRVVLAPLAGIGNWFVRLQAKRYGAGLAFSEMISSFAIHYGNRKTLEELLVVHPEEKASGPGAALISDPDTAVAVAKAAREGSGLPVTVKLRAALEPGGVEGLQLAHR